MSLSARDLASLDAGCAHIEFLGGTTHESAHCLNIGVPAARGAAVGVGDAVAKARALATDVTVGSHGTSPRDSMMMR